MFSKLAVYLVVGFSMLGAGCASVPMAAPEMDASAKTFSVQPGKANIYVYRNETLGAAIKHPVTLDGNLLGDTAANTFLLASVSPGPHTLVSLTQADSPLTLNTDGGKNYFVWLEMKMGMFSPGSKLHLVDEATGKQGVLECKLIQTVK